MLHDYFPINRDNTLLCADSVAGSVPNINMGTVFIFQKDSNLGKHPEEKINHLREEGQSCLLVSFFCFF